MKVGADPTKTIHTACGWSAAAHDGFVCPCTKTFGVHDHDPNSGPGSDQCWGPKGKAIANPCTDPFDGNGRRYIAHEAGSWVRDPIEYHPDDCSGCLTYNRLRRVQEALDRVNSPKTIAEEEAEELCPHQSGGYACQYLKGHYGGCVMGREAPYDYKRRQINLDRSTVDALDKHLLTVYAGTGVGRSEWIRDAIKAENAIVALLEWWDTLQEDSPATYAAHRLRTALGKEPK